MRMVCLPMNRVAEIILEQMLLLTKVWRGVMNLLGLPFFVTPEYDKTQNRQKSEAKNDEKCVGVLFQRNRDIHGKCAHHESRNHDCDRDYVESFHQDIKIIAHY